MSWYAATLQQAMSGGSRHCDQVEGDVWPRLRLPRWLYRQEGDGTVLTNLPVAATSMRNRIGAGPRSGGET